MNAGKKAVNKESSTTVATKTASKPKVAAKTASASAPAKAAAKSVASKSVGVKQDSTPVAKTATAAKTSVAKTSSKTVSTSASKTPAAAKPAPAKKATKPDSASFAPEYLVLQQKDPNWMHAFWDVSERRVQEATKGGSKLVLRLYDVSTDLTVRANKQRKFRDIEIPADARSWYVQNPGQSGSVSAALGTVSSSGGFEPIVNSDHVQSFGSEGQLIGAPHDDIFLRASLGGAQLTGFGSSGQMLPGVSSGSFLFAPSSEAFSSQSVSSASYLSQAGAPADIVNKGKDFFLWVKTRLIVYGGTRPDAHLQVRGQPFPLNPDGTFSLEMDLPDSTQIIPVFATDREGDFPTTIIPIVVKRTE